jgi:hypothetical protein
LAGYGPWSEREGLPLLPAWAAAAAAASAVASCIGPLQHAWPGRAGSVGPGQDVAIAPHTHQGGGSWRVESGARAARAVFASRARDARDGSTHAVRPSGAALPQASGGWTRAESARHAACPPRALAMRRRRYAWCARAALPSPSSASSAASARNRAGARLRHCCSGGHIGRFLRARARRLSDGGRCEAEHGFRVMNRLGQSSQ